MNKYCIDVKRKVEKVKKKYILKSEIIIFSEIKFA